jgi:alpha-amylase
VFEAAYRPFVEALERRPGIRVGLHYSGPLVEWLRAERPGFLDRVRALVERGQVEVLGGGWFEPILASLPERDRLVQLERMADEVEATFGARPAGAWLAERVWEPSLPASLAAAGYRWTVLDDEHFRAASVGEDELWGAYTTEDQGRLVTVFGSGTTLRYGIPFREVDEVIGHLRANARPGGRRVGMMGDDGEKLGAWPTTFEHCWGKGRWVERFLEALEENRSWLATATPSEWLDAHPPVGRIAIPTSSYTEMGEWVLPPAESVAFTRTLERARAEGRPEARWLRGGFWRGFQVRYREINDLHKQMLRTSAKVAAMPPGPERDRATDELGRGQSNDCYWHGLFGGIYLAHMRLATYEHVIAAEDVADRAGVAAAGAAGASGAAAGPQSGVLADLDLDGRDEVLLATDGQVVTVKPNAGAGIGSWDVRAARHALLAVMRRRPEAYHAALLEQAEAQAREPRAAAGEAAEDDDSVTSIHEIMGPVDRRLVAALRYDAYERRSGLVHLLGPDVDAARFATGDFGELLDAVDGPFDVVELSPTRVVVRREASVRVAADALGRVRIERALTIGGGRLDPRLETETLVENVGEATVEGRLAVEWNVMLLGGGGNPQAWWELPSRRIRHDARAVEPGVRELGQGNDWVGIRVDTSVTPAADAWIAPIETISKSEAGFERVYQGSCLLLGLPVTLAPGSAAGIRVEHRVGVSADRAEAVR